jgi:hypothetical protein
MTNCEQCVREGRPSPLRFEAFLQLLYLICFGARLSGRPSTSTLCQEMKPDHTRKLIGGLAALLGACWTLAVIVPMIAGLWADSFEAFDVVFLLTIVPLMAVPGVLAVVFGSRLFLEMRNSSLKWVLGVFAVYFAFFLSSRTSDLLPLFFPEDLQHSVVLFVASLVALVAYLQIVRWLLRHLTHENHSLRSLLSRGVLVLMALQIWLLLSDVFEEYSPIEEGYTHVPKEPWGILSLIVPVVVAYCFYRAALPNLARAQQDITPNR